MLNFGASKPRFKGGRAPAPSPDPYLQGSAQAENVRTWLIKIFIYMHTRHPPKRAKFSSI